MTPQGLKLDGRLIFTRPSAHVRVGNAGRGIEAIMQTQPPPTFSRWSIARAAIAASVSAYLLFVASVTLLSLEIVGQSHGGPTITLTDLILMTALSSFALTYILGGIVLAVAAGLFILAIWTGDKTTFFAAASAGVGIAAFISLMLVGTALAPLFDDMLAGRFSMPVSDLIGMAQTSGMLLATGVLSGLAGRLAAGPPKSTPAPV